MQDPDHAQIILRGKLRDEDDGSWIWCAIVEENWSQLVPFVYTEVGVFALPKTRQTHANRPMAGRGQSATAARDSSPTRQRRTTDGSTILFYGKSLQVIPTAWILIWSPVKALFKYRAADDEEFDFEKDDIIAVTSAPKMGWWTGELVDKSRKQPQGRNSFPSNYVTVWWGSNNFDLVASG